jgi:hypothetical protein
MLNPAFNTYIEDSKKFFADNNCTKTAEMYASAFEDYILMKQKQAVELQIMEANRVGVDKNLANIIS